MLLKALFLIFLLVASAWAEEKPNYRGWDYLAGKLIERGVSQKQVDKFFSDSRLPPFENIPFASNPLESHALYGGFANKQNIKKARAFLSKHRKVFDRFENKYGVPRKVIAAILLVETGFGANTGNALVAYRLCRLVGLADPQNVKWNFERLRSLGEDNTFEQIERRAKLLEHTFLPELPVLLSLSNRGAFELFELKGSNSGAFGLPQFLPTSFVRFGCDGDGDHKVSLFNPPDAICSVANYLHGNGWHGKLTQADKMVALYAYNKSEPYGLTVLKLAKLF